MLGHVKRVSARGVQFDFVRFSLVGSSGFIINFLLLTFLYRMIGLPVFFAQLLSSEVALFSNFLLHHHWTYKRKRVLKSISKLLVQFHVSSWVAIIGSALLVSLGVNALQLNYVVALIISSGVALLWNFLWTKLVIWRHQHDPPQTE